MPPGTSWYRGALNALLQVRTHDDETADLIGWLVLSEDDPQPRAELQQVLREGVISGRYRGVGALRGCAVLSRQHPHAVDGAQCSRSALDRGIDSSWHLLELVRWLAEEGDTTAAVKHFDAALDAARDSSSWADIGWHLGWFLEPDEQAAWDSIPDALRATWVRDRLATRDVRDGRTPGSRLVEHFERLTYIETHFRHKLPKKNLERFRLAAIPVSTLRDQDWIRSLWEPGLAAAKPFRFHISRYPEFDDRAVIWMRFGAPTKRITWTGRDREPIKGIDPKPTGSAHERRRIERPYTSNIREVWRYDLDGQSLLLHFEAEEFDGSAEATRLVIGVLGHYLCAVDTYRCNLTARAATDGMALKVEQVAGIEAIDREHLAEATTKDDNTLRSEHHLSTAASFHRLWNPATGELVALVPWAVKLQDLRRSGDSAVVDVTLRQWDKVAGSWQEQRQTRRVILPHDASGDAWLTGQIVVPTAPTASSWSIVATQESSHTGRAWSDRVDPLTALDGLELSDLIAGDPAQGQAWQPTGGDQIPAAALGSFKHSTPLTLSWQVRSRAALDSVTTVITIYRIDHRGDDTPKLEVRFDSRLESGLHLFQRDLGVDRLENGPYRLALTLRLPDGRSLQRSTRINIE